MQILRSVWTYIGLGILGGVLLTTVVHEKYPSDIFLRLGDALIIASLVGGLLHVKEVSVLFETLARKTLVQDEYLMKLSSDQLRKIRSLTLQLTVGKAVNNPDHRWRDLESTIESQVLFQYLPDDRNPKAGLYRSDYDEAIALKFMTLGESFEDAHVEVPAEAQGDPQLGLVKVRKHTTTTSFEIIASRTDIEIEFEYPLEFMFGEVPFFPTPNRVKSWVGEEEASAEEIHFDEPKVEAGLITFKKKVLLKVRGSRSVWVKTEEWYDADDPRFILNTMSFLTRGLSLAVSSDQPLRFGGGIFGIGRESPAKVMEHGVSLRYDNWLLEENGYIIWWDNP